MISFETANRYANNNQIEYYESSAKTGHQVSDIYEKLAINMVNTFEYEESKGQKFSNKSNKEFNEIHLDSQSEYSRKNKKKKNCCNK